MKKLLFLALFLWVANAQAATYYVSTTGNDANTCTQAQSISTPKLTIQAGISCQVGAGNTTYVRGGTYATRFGVWVSGTTGNPNVLASYPGEVVNLTRPNAALTAMIAFSGTHDITLDGGTNCQDSSLPLRTGIGTPLCGFVVDAGHGGLFVDDATNNIIMRGVEIDGKDFKHDPQGELGILVGHSSGVQILGNYIHNMGEKVTAGSPDPPGGYGIYFTGFSGIMDGNDIGFNDHFGIHHFTAGGAPADNNIMRNNRVYHSGKAGSGDADGMLIFSGTGSYAYNNIIWASGSGGNGIILSSNAAFVSHLYGNTIYSNAAYGISYAAGTGKEIINNILYQNTVGAFTDQGTGSTGVSFQTNLCGASETHCAVVGNPLFTNAAGNDFTLQAGSPAVNAGTTLVSPYNVDFFGAVRPNNAFDIGAIERGGTPPTLRTLTLASSNPASGCLITVSQPGTSGITSANTQWNATYFDGTSISATATATCAGNDFVKWQQDGVDFSTSLSTPNFTMSADHTMTAVFSTPALPQHTLTIASANPVSGAEITVSPDDLQNRNSGVSQFSRVYNTNSAVTVIARANVKAPLAWLKLEEGSGTTAGDSSNDGLNGTLSNGPTWVAGLAGGSFAVQLNGTTQFISIPTSPLFNNLPGLRLALDYKPSASLTGFKALIVHNYKWGLYASSTGFVNASSVPCTNGALGFLADAADNFYTVCDTTPLVSGTIYHLEFTFDGSTLILTKNGVTVDTATHPIIIGNVNGAVQIGASQFGEYAPGVVDNIEICGDTTCNGVTPGNTFQSWSGCDSATTFTCNSTLSADKTVTANYITAGTQFTITVNTVNPTNVTGMSVDTVDINGSPTTNLTAPFTRTYIGGPYITVNAPLTSGSNTFVAWAGCDATNIGSVASCHVFATSNRTVTATYSSPTVRALTLVSVNPTSGVAITGITADLSSQTSCTTPNCALTYNDSTSVVATAPATVGSNTFSAWTGCTSVSGAGNRTCNMTMNADKVGTVTYTTPPAACTTSIKAGSVSITVKGNALIANCNGG